MRRLRALLLRLSGLFRRERVENDLAAEIESHLQLHVDEHIRQGMAPAEARRQAVLALGGVESAKERYRERRGLPGLESLLQDLRLGARMLWKNPGFTAVAVFTLAVGLGPMTTIFALANWAVLRPIPGVRAPEDVARFTSGVPSPRGGVTVHFISYPNYRDIAERLRTVRLAGHQSLAANVTAGQQGERVINGSFVSASFFDVLGVDIQRGRGFVADEDDPADPALIAVISDWLWASLFDRDPGAMGQTLRVNGHVITIVGIAAPEFRGLDRIATADLWLPGGSQPVVTYQQLRPDSTPRTRGAYYQWVARLAPGATWPQARAELDTLTTWLREQHPVENEGLKTFQFSGPLNSGGLGQRLVPVLAIAMGAMAIVLLITCSNVACLLLIRGVGRREEVATRKALGAGGWRLLRQHVTEGLLLWVLGAVVGGVLLVGLMGVVERMAVVASVTDLEVPIDWRVLLFAASLTLGVGLVFSVLPALRAMRVEVTQALKQGGGPTATRASFATGSVLTVIQLSASLTMLVGALLLTATLRHLAQVDLGFDPAEVTGAILRPGAVGLTRDRSAAYYEEVMARVARQPGIESVALAADVPMLLSGRTVQDIRRAGEPPEASIAAWASQPLSATYFETLGIRTIDGRVFTEDEIAAGVRGDGRAVMLSAALAHRLFGTTSAAGRFVEFRPKSRAGRYEVIGVTADIKYFDLSEEPPLLVLDPVGFGPGTPTTATLLVRASAGTDARALLRNAAASVNATVPVTIQPLSEAVQRARIQWDVLTWLMIAFAVVASGLSAVGVYGLVAFGAAARRGEFGIRAAFGAAPGDIRRLVFRRASRLGIAGLFFGLAGSYALSRALESLLVGVQPFDKLLWSLAAAGLVAIVIGASLLPARRAARVNPADTLRAT